MIFSKLLKIIRDKCLNGKVYIKLILDSFLYSNLCRMFTSIKQTIMTYRKSNLFEVDLQKLAEIAGVMSHPARLAILRYLAKCNTCISGDISKKIPLSRTTVSQHLQALKKVGLIHGEIDGLKVNYCLCSDCIKAAKLFFEGFLNEISTEQKNQC